MYAGTTLKPLKYFDAWLGAHQKIDRMARRNLTAVFEGHGYHFPSAREIMRFEGINGPDGIKRKAPGLDEPWHFYDPYDPSDTKLITTVEEHYQVLVSALRTGNQARAAFEASWLAHAIVDGLTPAHHYPYEEELLKLRGGKGVETRTNVKEQLIMHGETVSKKLGNNWKMWGDKGLLATHFAFEWGVAVLIPPLKRTLGKPDDADLVKLRQEGIGELFKQRASQVAALEMYDTFYRSGWTPKLARQVRRELLPLIINTVTLAWYGAVLDSQKEQKKRQSRKPA